jgi:hypothetical protein
MKPEQKPQVPMMAMNRGFLVDREAVEAADELDLIPMAIESEGVVVRVHVLVASNALYAKMVNDSVGAVAGATPVRVVSAEDLALMILVGDAPQSSEQIDRVVAAAGPHFDREKLNEKLMAIGLQRKVLTR